MQAEERVTYLAKILLTIETNRIYVERAIESVDEKKLTAKGLVKYNDIKKELLKTSI